jgi:hypothetical protein
MPDATHAHDRARDILKETQPPAPPLASKTPCEAEACASSRRWVFVRRLAFIALLCTLLASGWTLTHTKRSFKGYSFKGYSLAEVQAAAVASADVSDNATYVAVTYPRVSRVERLPNGNRRVDLSIWIYGRSAPRGAEHDVIVVVSPGMQIVDAREVARQ